jgi:hypothetical protein
MQWRKLVPETASYISVYKHTHRCAPSVTTERLFVLEASLPMSARVAAVGRIEAERLQLGILAQEASASGAKRRRDDAVESDAQRILRTSDRLAAVRAELPIGSSLATPSIENKLRNARSPLHLSRTS